MKRCAKCKEEKPLEEFWKNRATSDGLQPYCKPCGKEHAVTWRRNNRDRVREWENTRYKTRPEIRRCKKNSTIKKKFGITHDELDAMILEQDNKCAICLNTFPNSKSTHIDHCHKTGIVRGILCTSCNNGLGRFKDSVEVLRNAIVYLNERSASTPG